MGFVAPLVRHERFLRFYQSGSVVQIPKGDSISVYMNECIKARLTYLYKRKAVVNRLSLFLCLHEIDVEPFLPRVGMARVAISFLLPGLDPVVKFR